MKTVEYIDWLVKTPQAYTDAMASCTKLMQETLNKLNKEK